MFTAVTPSQCIDQPVSTGCSSSWSDPISSASTGATIGSDRVYDGLSCTTAFPIAAGVTDTQTFTGTWTLADEPTVGQTVASCEPAHTGTGRWYSFNATGTTVYTLMTCSGTDLDTAMALKSSCAVAACYSVADDDCGVQSYMSNTYSAGTWYVFPTAYYSGTPGTTEFQLQASGVTQQASGTLGTVPLFDSSACSANALRLMYRNEVSLRSWYAYDVVGTTAPVAAIVQFEFRAGSDTSAGGGFSVSLLPTATYSSTGAPPAGLVSLITETPLASNVFGVGFGFGGTPSVKVYYNSVLQSSGTPAWDFRDAKWTHVSIAFVQTGASTTTVTVTLTRDVSTCNSPLDISSSSGSPAVVTSATVSADLAMSRLYIAAASGHMVKSATDLEIRNLVYTAQDSATCSASVTPSGSVTPSITPSPSVTPSTSTSPSNSPSPTPSVSPSVTPSVTPSVSATSSLTPTESPTMTPSQTPSVTPTVTQTPSTTNTASASFTNTATASSTASVTLTPSVTPSPSSSPPIACNAACDLTALPPCTDTSADTCGRCNEAGNYVRAKGSASCVALPCPSGQFEDTSGGKGELRCAAFVPVATCGTPCSVTKDGTQRATIALTLSRPACGSVTFSVTSLSPSKGHTLNATVVLPGQAEGCYARTYDAGGVVPASGSTGDIVVVGVDNLVVDGPIPFDVKITLTASGDSRYSSIVGYSTTVSVMTIDTTAGAAAFQAYALAPYGTAENGTSCELRVRMAFNPSTSVAMSALLSAASLSASGVAALDIVAISTNTVFFDAATWNVEQTLTLTGVRDFIERGTIAYSVELSASGYTGTTVWLQSIDVDVASVTASPASVVVTELGDTVDVSVVLGSKPLSDVVLRVASSNTVQAKVVGTGQAVIAPATWSTPRTFTVQGQRDTLDAGNQPFTLTISTDAATAGTAVGRYAAQTWTTVAGTNIAITFPDVITIGPTTLPLVGGTNITVTGGNFMEGVMVYFGSDMVTNTVGTSFLNIRLGSSRKRDNVRTLATSSFITFNAPQTTAQGYMDIRIVNPDGGFQVQQDAFFLTEDCPSEGQFGRGVDCIVCPSGGYCPGGYRIWPLTGYWNEGETSGYVQACPDPSSRCVGGQASACATGYEGVVCSRCSFNYFQKGALCEQCGSSSVLVALLIADAVFFVLLALCFVFFAEKQLRFVVAAITVLQSVRSVGQSASSRLPSFLQEIYYYLSLISFDVSFLRTQCIGSGAGYSVVFFANLVLFVALVTPTALLLLLMGFVIRRANKARYFDRMLRALTIFADVLYLVICTRMFQAVYCLPNGSGTGSYLWADGDSTCYTGVTRSVNALGYVLLFLFVLGYPVAVLIFLKRMKQKGMLDDKTITSRYGYLYAQYKDSRYYFVGVHFFRLCLLGLATAVGSSNLNAQLSVSIIAFCPIIFGIAILRPHKDVLDAAIALLSAFAGIAGVVINYVGGLSSVPQQTLNALIIAVAVLAFLSFASLVAYVVFKRRDYLRERCHCGRSSKDSNDKSLSESTGDGSYDTWVGTTSRGTWVSNAATTSSDDTAGTSSRFSNLSTSLAISPRATRSRASYVSEESNVSLTRSPVKSRASSVVVRMISSPSSEGGPDRVKSFDTFDL